MTSIYICRSIPIEQDSRVQRFRDILRNAGHDVKIIQWGGSKSNAEDVFISPILRVRDNPWANLFLTPLFCIWLTIFLLIKVKKTDYVIAVDLDTALPAFTARSIRKFKYFFDIADPYSLCRFKRRVKIVDWLEYAVGKQAVLTIVPAECRTAFYPKDLKACIIENIPIINNCSHTCFIRDSSLFHVGYFGSLEVMHRGLELLASTVIARNDIVLHVGGVGGLSDFFSKMALDYPDKIRFYGRFAPNDLPILASNCHMLFAFYSLTKEHHKYVAANKLYEHLYLGIPILTNEGTNFAEQVLNWQTGYAILESKDSLDNFFNVAARDKNHLEKMGLLALDRWNVEYRNYWAESAVVKKLINSFG